MESSKKKTIAIVVLVVLVVFAVMFGAKEFGQKQTTRSIAENEATTDKAIEMAKDSAAIEKKYEILDKKYATRIEELTVKINNGEKLTASEKRELDQFDKEVEEFNKMQEEFENKYGVKHE